MGRIFKTTAIFAVLFVFPLVVEAAGITSFSVSPSTNVIAGQEYIITVKGYGAGYSTLTTVLKEDGTEVARSVCSTGIFGNCTEEGIILIKILKKPSAGRFVYTATAKDTKNPETATSNPITVIIGSTVPPPPPPTTPPPTPPPATGGTPGQGPIPLPDLGDPIIIPNPLAAKTFQELLDTIVSFILWVGLAVAPVVIIIAGFFYVTSAGSPQRIETAKTMITYSLVGVAVLLLATGLVQVLKSILGVK